MMMKKLKSLILVAGIVCILPAASLAAGNAHDTNTHGLLLECDDQTRENHLYLMNAEKLGLTEEQIEKLRNIKGDCDKFCVVEKARLRVAKMELDQIMKSEAFDQEAAEVKIKEISELQNRLRVRHIKTRAEAMMVLDKKQKEQAKDLRPH